MGRGGGLGGERALSGVQTPPGPAAQVPLCDLGHSPAPSGPQSLHLCQGLRLGPRIRQDVQPPLRMGAGRPSAFSALTPGRTHTKGLPGRGSRALGYGPLRQDTGRRWAGVHSQPSRGEARPRCQPVSKPGPPASIFGRSMSHLSRPLSRTSPIPGSTAPCHR